MGHFLFKGLRCCVMAGCFAAAAASHAAESGLLGIYPFVDHSGMHHRTQPLLDFLRQRQVSLKLDVADTYDELLRRGMRREYTVLQVPAHFGLYLQRCCGYRVVAGWQDQFDALVVTLDDPASPSDTNRPQLLAVASVLAFASMAVTGHCAAQTTDGGRLQTLVPSSTHERALQALLRKQVDLAAVSSTSILMLHPDLQQRLKLRKKVEGLPADVILVRAGKGVTPDWQWALQYEFPGSAEAKELQRRWHRRHGMAPATRLQLQRAEPYTALLGSCLPAQLLTPVPSVSVQ